MAARKGNRAAVIYVMQSGAWFGFADLQAELPSMHSHAISTTIRHMREDGLMDADATYGYRKMRYKLTGIKSAAIVPVFVKPVADKFLLAACWRVAHQVAEAHDGV